MNARPTPFLNRSAIKRGKRFIVGVAGGTVLAVGLALVVLPGPAFLVIPAGLAILAMEFGWARRWLRKAKGLLPNMKPRRDGFSFLAGELPPRQGRGGVPQRYSFNTNESNASTKSNS